MIGIIQPKNNNNELLQMGCIGKITSYIETPDYRLVLVLRVFADLYCMTEILLQRLLSSEY